jgi:hypothetical protein
VQRAQLGARLDAQLGGQRPARGLVRVQRLGLPPAPVQRDHQQPAQRLAERVLAAQRGQLADDHGVPPQSEVGLDPRLQDGEPPFGQPDPRGLGVRPRQAGQRGAVPEIERAAEELPGMERVPPVA